MTTLAHGIGGAADLPIPLTYALLGAAWALAFSFAVIAFAWREPRLDPAARGKPVPATVRAVVDSPVLRAVVAVVSVAATALLLAVGVFGPADPAANPVPGVVYVLMWVGVMVASLVAGPVWKLLSPARALHRALCAATGRAPEDGWLRYPRAWGRWPAAFGLFTFVWLELASPDPGSVAAVTSWVAGYLIVTVLGSVVFGAEWAEHADPLEVYSSLLGRLSPLGRDTGGALVLRSPLANLAGTPVGPGSVAVAATLLGSTAFDSFSLFEWWRGLLADAGGSFPRTVVSTAGLLVFIAVVGVSFRVAAAATGGLDRTERRLLPTRLAYTLTPIIAGYVVAHYLSFLVEKGQATVILFADPFAAGWNLFGLADREVAYLLSAHPAMLGTIKVVAVVTGHVLGVAAAHDRCLRLLPPAHRLTGQLALMLLMVGYTFTGLYLLFDA
ncbi:hypothetical protein [Nocardia carnea]|uniref:hypothetical protein n=1 Tax=Nocardia carnea TaxID=37328 RepID=UPI0024540613|nr:hypothetical protein [Nocardia carnea]